MKYLEGRKTLRKARKIATIAGSPSGDISSLDPMTSTPGLGTNTHGFGTACLPCSSLVVDTTGSVSAISHHGKTYVRQQINNKFSGSELLHDAVAVALLLDMNSKS